MEMWVKRKDEAVFFINQNFSNIKLKEKCLGKS